MDESVAVIGGGYAGIAAAVRLCQAGIRVTLFEAARELGGRARRISSHGLDLDNGQHILLGAYSETLKMIGEVGAARGYVRTPLELDLGSFYLKSRPLPAPWHMAAALIFARGIDWSEKKLAIRFITAMQRCKFRLESDEPLLPLLARNRQSEKLIRYLWNPLCVSALNTPIESASAQLFLNVVRDGMMASSDASDMLLPSTDLTRLFPEPAAAYIEARGGVILKSTAARSIRQLNSGFEIATDHLRHEFERVICAAPPYRAQSLLERLPELGTVKQQLSGIEYQPIYTVYLQYPASFSLERLMLGQASGLAQWFFDRGALCGQTGLVAAVISAAGSHQRMPHDELAKLIHLELKARCRQLPDPLWSQVIAEKRATFAAVSGLARPEQLTPLTGFFLAGDYTCKTYPATIEGAIRSGQTAAQLVVDSLRK